VLPEQNRNDRLLEARVGCGGEIGIVGFPGDLRRGVGGVQSLNRLLQRGQGNGMPPIFLGKLQKTRRVDRHALDGRPAFGVRRRLAHAAADRSIFLEKLVVLLLGSRRRRLPGGNGARQRQRQRQQKACSTSGIHLLSGATRRQRRPAVRHAAVRWHSCRAGTTRLFGPSPAQRKPEPGSGASHSRRFLGIGIWRFRRVLLTEPVLPAPGP